MTTAKPALPSPDRFTVLVVGHRTDRLEPAALPALAAKLAQVLTVMRDAGRARGAELRMLTGVADGSDALAAEVAVQLGLPLELLAPGMPQPLTAAQQKADNVVWLGAPAQPDGDEAFAVHEEVARGLADLVVVVWDGNAPRGLNGGTVRLALHAATAMTPMVWISPAGEVRLLERTRLTARAMQRLNGAHPEPDWLREVFGAASEVTALEKALADEVALAINPTAVLAPNKEDAGHPLSRLARYCTLPPFTRPDRAGHLHDAMLAIISGNVKKAWAKRKPISKEPYWGPAKPVGEHPIEAPKNLETQFGHSDVRATVAAGRHRNGTWLIYGASAFAVFAAVAGAIGLWPGGHGPIWAITELLALALIIGLFFKAKSARWHEEWLGQRFIAEQVRYARMGLPMLAVPRVFYKPAWEIKDDKLNLLSPELWLIQRTLKRQGLPRASSGGTYLASAPAVTAQLSAYVSQVVEDQRQYHERNHNTFHTVHHRMHGLSIGLFVATALAVPAHFLLHANWLLIMTAFFPALAAAMHGLATKLEIARLSNQHDATEHELADLTLALNDAGRSGENDWLNWLRLRSLALQAAAVMSDENDQWQQLIGHQDPELPA